MAHKIRVTKNDNVEYPGNVFLTITLIIGLIFFILGYSYSIYVRLNLFDILSHNLTTHIIFYFLLGFGNLAIVIVSVILIVIDGNNLNIGRGLNYPGQRLFKSKTWYIHRWAILIFFFWIIFYPLYIYRRREIYEINKDVQSPLAYEGKHNRGIVAMVIIAIVFASSLSTYLIYQQSIQDSIGDDGITFLEAKEIGDEYIESLGQEPKLIRAEEIEPMMSDGKYSGWNLFYINTIQPTPSSLVVYVGVLAYNMEIHNSGETDFESLLQAFNMANNSLTINTDEIIDTDEIYNLVNASSIVRDWLESNPQHSYSIVLTANVTGPVWDIEWGAKYTGPDPSLNHEGLYVQVNANSGQINYVITETT